MEVTHMAKDIITDEELDELTDESEETESDQPPMTPKALAQELGINPKTLRAYLRREHTRSSQEKNTSWKLTDAQVEAARVHFTAADDESEEGDEGDE
jgi:hypothetical protein